MSEETEAPEVAQEQAEPSAKSSNSFLFRGVIEVFPYDELPYLSRAGAKACRAVGKGGEELYAVFCDRSALPRTDAVAKYNMLQVPQLGKLVASGVSGFSKAEKELLDQQYYIFIFENIYGEPLWKEGDSLALSYKPEQVRKGILPSLISFLQTLKQSDFLHGSLHLGNIYTATGVEGGESVGNICVRECLSLPFSYDMPPLYLPVARASVPPIGRGRCVFEDEVYSLGVVLSLLLRKTDPCAGFSDAELIKAKMELGSYQAIVGENRIDVYFLNALRGMLQDDPEQRWTMDDVSMWLDGQRIGVKQGGLRRLNANRPLAFGKGNYLRPELLGYDFQESVQDAHQLIIGGELAKWIDRSVANPALKSRLQGVLDEGEKYGQKLGYVERKVAQVSLVLNHDSPLYYKEVSISPDGLGTSFAKSAAVEDDLTSYAELLNINLIPFWVENQKSDAVDTAVILSGLESCRMSLKQAGFGYGLERCCYLLGSEVPCLSPKFSEYYIKTPEDYFWALNDMCLSGKAPERIVDRHVAAFLSVRDRQMIDAYMFDMNSQVLHTRALALLRMLATIQVRGKLEKATGITNWIVKNLSKPLIERLHDRELRAQIGAKLNKMAGNGDVGAIAALFEKETALKQDQNAFQYAMQEYQGLLNQEKIMDYNIQHNKRYGQGTGREVAAMVSAALSFLVVLMILVTSFGNIFLG